MLFANFYYFFLLPYWWITGQLYNKLDEKVSYMHYSCFKKQKFGEKATILIASSYDRIIKAIYLIGLLGILGILILMPTLPMCSFHKSSDTFIGLFEGPYEGGCRENIILQVIPLPLYVLLGLLLMLIYVIKVLPWYLSNRYIKNKLNF